MRSFASLPAILFVGLGCVAADRPDEPKGEASAWTSDFSAERPDLASSGRNAFFILEPGRQLEYEDGKEHLTITVLSETEVVDGVETRIVEERETKGGETVEVSRNYFAISKRTGSVFYFGEDVDMYKAGKVANHEGSWRSGVNGAKFGLMMPGTPLLGGRYCQESAPDVAMDRAEIVSLTKSVKTPAGEFVNCLATEETSPLEPGSKEFKHYAPGVGLVQDGSLKLVKRPAPADPKLSQAASETLTEPQKIERLLEIVASMKDAVFIRNGTEQAAVEAADHLRMKWKAAGSRVDTATQFIEQIASRSSASNQPYQIRLAGGSVIAAGDFLKQRLSEIEKDG